MTALSAAVETPIFVVGAERSGSTMLWLMLDHHPEIAMAGQMEYAVQPDLSQGWPDPDEYHQMISRDLMFETSGFDADMALPYPELMHSFLQQRLDVDTKRYVGAVVHIGFAQLPLIWPEARYIHLVRDGRDVANSAVRLGWVGHPYYGADIWIEAEHEWDALSATLESDKKHEVRFEELVREPERLLAELCDFVGVSFDPAMFDYAESTDYDLPQSSLAEQWRHMESSKTLQQVETKLAPMLRARGYVPSVEGTPSLSRLEDLWLPWANRWGKVSDRVRRFGPLLTARELATRAPGLSRQNVKAQDQMREIIKADRKRHWSEDAEILR